MCPDRQILSLYFDGELPSPWNEKMKAHLGTCQKCQIAVGGYNFIGMNLRELPVNPGSGRPQNDRIQEDTVQSARERVWKNLTSPELISPLGLSNTRSAGITENTKYTDKVWKRSITLPLPAAAAAAVLIIGAFIVFIGIQNGNKPMPQDSLAAANIGLDNQGVVPVADMNGVLKYLSSQDNGDVTVVRLPDRRSFTRLGEPALINAADYSRRSAP